MEILVSDHWGVPADCVVSIRCGGTRRQAPLDVAAKQVLKFPVGREALNEPLKIDVLRPVATARLVIHPHEDEYAIGFLDHDDMEIGLNIKPGKLAGNACTYANDSRPTSAKSVAGKLEAATSARDYLEMHGVLRYVQGLLHALIQLRPEDPFLFMMEQLSARKNPMVRPRPSSPEQPDKKPTPPPGLKPTAKPRPPPPPVPPAPLPANSPRAAPEDGTAQAEVQVVAPVPTSVTAANLDTTGAQPSPDSAKHVATAANLDTACAQAASNRTDLVETSATAAEKERAAVTAMIYKRASLKSHAGDSAASASVSAALPSQQKLETSPALTVSSTEVASSPAAASSAQNPTAANADPASASAATLDDLEIDMEQADELQPLPQAESFGDLLKRAGEKLTGAAQNGALGDKLAEVMGPSLVEERTESAASAQPAQKGAAGDHAPPSLPEEDAKVQEGLSEEAAEATRGATRSASDSFLFQASPSAGSVSNVKKLQVELEVLTEESRALHGEVDRLNSEMITLMETNQALLRQCGLKDAGAKADEACW